MFRFYSRLFTETLITCVRDFVDVPEIEKNVKLEVARKLLRIITPPIGNIQKVRSFEGGGPPKANSPY